MQARYANGHAAVIHDASVEFTPEGVLIVAGAESQLWPYAEIRRADDELGPIILKRRPDTGQRLTIAREDRRAVRKAAPQLFSGRAREMEGPVVIGGLMAAAWAVALLFLIGVPLEAKPIADAVPDRWRDRISDLSWNQLATLTAPCDDSDAANHVLNSLAQRLMTRSQVRQRDKVWISIVRAGSIGPNAFTLPDDRIVVTDALIALADNPDEIAGVISHEIAHAELNHVMASVIRRIGAGFFFDVVFGGGGIGQIVAASSVTFAHMPFSRGDESAADARGMEYLDKAGIDPGAIARLFDRMAALEKDRAPRSGLGSLLANHPPTAERAAIARSRAHAGRAPALTPTEWRIVQRACGGSTRRAQSQASPEPPGPPQASRGNP